MPIFSGIYGRNGVGDSKYGKRFMHALVVTLVVVVLIAIML